MVEMAASASASLAARSLAAFVPGAGSWRNEAFGGAAVFGQLGGHAAGFDGAPHGRLARPGFFRRFTKPQNSHCHSSHEKSLGDGGATGLTKG
jgi:hypothetical protein